MFAFYLISGAILKRHTMLKCLNSVLFILFSLFTYSLHAAPASFSESKVLHKTQVYFDQNNQGEGTLYCGCQWEWVGKSGGKVDLASCHYQFRKQLSRAERIEWEHIVPAWVFGHQLQCWQKGGRKNCVSTDPIFGKMEADMHNLAPAIGEVNGDRSNYSFGQLSADAPYQYGQCRSRVDFKQKVFEPRDEVKGQVARVYFYMHDRYNLSMSRQQQQLFMAWDKLYPPSQWEKLRDDRIAKIMGHHNPFVTGESVWVLEHKNSGEGVQAPTSSKPAQLTPAQSTAVHSTGLTAPSLQIKGNRQSRKYHFAHCSGFKTTSDKNRVMFSTELEAKREGYQLAGNCQPR